MMWRSAALAVMAMAVAGIGEGFAQERVSVTRALRPSPGFVWRLDTLAISSNVAPDTTPDQSTVTDASVDSAGHILALDASGRRLIVLDQTLRPTRTVGRVGSGPGEFRLPYRLAVDDSGRVIVLDLTASRVTYYGRDLQWLTTTPLSVHVNASSFVVVGDELFIAGSLDAPAGLGAAIHVFGRDGQYRRSFGRLVRTANPMFQRFVAGGLLARAGRTALWYAQYSPYLIERYALDGRLELRIERPNEFLPSAEGAFRVQVSERSTQFTAPEPHALAAGLLQIGDDILVHQTRLASGRVVWDVYRATGRDWVLSESRENGGPVLLRRGLGDSYIGLVASDEERHAGLLVVRMRPGR